MLILMGVCSTLAGVGLGRFAYAAILPHLIQSGWLGASAAGFVGAANLLGYLLGAIFAGNVIRVWPTGLVMRTSAFLIAVSFFASAWPAPGWWFTLWRMVAGITGAFLIVVAPSRVAQNLAIESRKRGTTWVFTGIGLGVLLSATLVPTLMNLGLTETWIGLGMISLVPLVIVWRQWPESIQFVDSEQPALDHPKPSASRILILIYVSYGLDAVGFVPHTVFWVDYLERQLGFSNWAGGLQWAILAVGAVCGPFIVGFAARHLGWHRTLVTAFSCKGIAVLLPVISSGLVSVTLSSLIVGAMIPGVVATTAGRIGELVGPLRQTLAWGRATALFAIAQAGAAYGMATLYSWSHGSDLIFLLGGIALVAAGGITLMTPYLIPES